MKKTFLTKRNALLSSTDVSWGAYALAAAVVLLLLRLIAPNFFLQAFAPVFHTADALAADTHGFFSSFGNVADLALQNEKLQNENAALALENQTLLQKTASFDALGGTATTDGILAGVVARPPASPYDTLVLGAGTKQGVALGQEAFGAGGVPIGVVSSVLADFSRVTLFTAPGFRVEGWAGRLGTSATITGLGAGALQVSLSRSANISVGDSIFAPGPGMIPIGKVVRIDGDASSPSMTLRIMPAFNPFSTAWVLLRETGVDLISGSVQTKTP